MPRYWQTWKRELVNRTLASFENNRQRDAVMLGITRRALYNKIRSFGINLTAAESNPKMGHPCWSGKTYVSKSFLLSDRKKYRLSVENIAY
jgi:hypothetical protein